jgi:hypothetical protein
MSLKKIDMFSHLNIYLLNGLDPITTGILRHKIAVQTITSFCTTTTMCTRLTKSFESLTVTTVVAQKINQKQMAPTT